MDPTIANALEELRQAGAYMPNSLDAKWRGFEGIVSKRKHSPYKSGKCDWVKVKCAEWKEDNKDRGELFMR